jgi:putative tryptophan/tyrosine transport system substrate-binding protein
VNRRKFITLLSGAATWPIAARAQPPAIQVVGYLHPGSPEASFNAVAGFRKGLGETGYVEGRNVAIEFRWARNDNTRLAELAADLVRRQVAVIVTPIGTETARAAKAATTTIPIVFSAGTDPVKAGLVASLNRPGGNVTGLNYMLSELGSKRLALLHEMTPRAVRFGLLVNPTNPFAAESNIKDVETAAPAIGGYVDIVNARTNREIDMAFATFVQNHADAVLEAPDPLFFDRRVQLATLAVRHVLPAAFSTREFAEAGGLMSYGSNNLERHRELGVYTGRILKGEKPADMPVAQPTKFELVINAQTARMLSLEVPPTLLARADEVIE